MRPEDILHELRRQPFEPFRLYLSNGRSYDIRHPEMALVARRRLVVATRLGKEGVADQLATCDPAHVTDIEPLDGESDSAASDA